MAIDTTTQDAVVGEEWPSQGKLEYKDVRMSYGKGGEVLSGVSVKVGGGTKLAVVGRTGAGKSSLIMALFRIVELTQGTILIDDVDISKVCTIRKKKHHENEVE